MIYRRFAVIAYVCAMAFAAQETAAQNYPNRPVRVVTSEPGGGNEIAARMIAQGLSGALGQQVIIESKGGGNGAIAFLAVSKAAPDGYTLLFFSSALWVLPLMKDVPWDALRDFEPIVLVATAPNILVVHPSLPVKSVKELIALAKARPGELNYATGAAGAAAHLSAALLKSMARIDIVRIPFKGTSPGLNAVMAGQVQIMFPAAGAAMSHVKAGRLRALAVTSARSTDLAPGLPTMASAGLAGYESVSVYGLYAPSRTSASIVGRLNQETVRLLQTPELKERFFNIGVETVGSSPEEFVASIKADVIRWDKVIKEAGIRED